MRIDSTVSVESTRQVLTGTSTDTRPEDAGTAEDSQILANRPQKHTQGHANAYNTQC